MIRICVANLLTSIHPIGVDTNRINVEVNVDEIEEVTKKTRSKLSLNTRVYKDVMKKRYLEKN